MDELLQTIAEQKGYPAVLVQRSAEARAQVDGVSVDDVLRAWSGGGDAPAPAAPAAAPEAPATPAPAEPEAAAEAASDGPKVEVLEPAVAEEAPKDEVPEPEPVRTGLPRWLVAAFVVLPSIALLYALVSPAGPDCGSSGALAIDPETGVAENCDGTEYGVDASDLFSIGQAVYEAQCTACHGAGGGGGVGPAFTNGAILATFSACADHIEWVAVGSNAWPEPTYGDTEIPVLGSGVAMPGFSSLTNDELIAVSLYERVAFGGEDRAAAEESCAAGAEEVLAAP